MKRWLINEQTDATKKKIAEEGIYLYATHAPEWEHNKKMLKKLNESGVRVIAVRAINSGTHAVRAGEVAGVNHICYLARGARVMLTSNAGRRMTTLGLANGAILSLG